MSQDAKNTVDRLQMLQIIQAARDDDRIPLLVTGMSMVPFLFSTRSMVYLKKESAYVPKRGDIVFFMREDTSPVLHRVVKIREDGVLVINGDAQSWQEEIRPEQVLARVTHIRRRIRLFSVENRLYRLAVRIWMPLRRFHPVLYRPFHLLNCAYFKLSRKYRDLYS